MMQEMKILQQGLPNVAENTGMGSRGEIFLKQCKSNRSTNHGEWGRIVLFVCYYK